ncbi:FAD:protein FMN transferase, partial [candidate division KSB1 bacterium]|nr:FAD:protein FMN transferase [candidate division KSB1 bacterium]
MATIFEIRIHHNDRVYAEQAAVDAFRLLDRIESDLNRHDPNSDVSQLNAAEPGEEIRLGLHAYQCLQLAFVVHEASRGAFDVTVGGIKDLYAQAGSWWQRLTGRCAAKTHRVGMRHMQMVDDRRAVILDAPVTVDLGGIGKGYA